MTQKLHVGTPIHHFQLPEFTQFISSSLANLSKKEISLGDDIIVTTQIAKLKQQLPELEKLIKLEKSAANSLTASQADKTRDNALTAFFQTVKAGTKHPNAGKQAAAKSLFELIKTYNGIQKENYEKETALVTSLLAKLASDPYQEHVETLDLADYVKGIKSSQDIFYDVFLNKTDMTISEVRQKGKALRQNMQADYALLYSHLQNLVTFDPKSDYKAMLEAFNKIRIEYTNIMERKQKKSAKKAEKTEELAVAGE